ncbi:hypothetical protein BCR33DRAFT_719152 [Rhizoclosmatium globosum]|uniref:Uncharacterized protein n=1 Tax=Rhizoclosmatium globosum TaxID=329046 RepID=A0A1Y2C1Z1_9FUNG|nr:hypothetical protein BCR33DRAFT_719152 [Rhizoclosmatium globosum]|eukprot:ORY41063.1 hypothetical protein BCR33DRAFT_719152 [Rhizoclosmatium globosum]
MAQPTNEWTSSFSSDFNETYAMIHFIEAWITVAVSIFQIALLGILVYRESSENKNRVVFTQVNCFLLFSIATNCLALVFIEFGKNTKGTGTYQSFYILSIVSYFAYQFLVVQYTLNRGLPDIQALISTSRIYFIILVVVIQTITLTLVMISIIMVLATDVAIFSNSANVLHYFQSVCDGLIFVFDLAVLSYYGLYLHKVKRDGYDFEVKRLYILSQFGVASFIVFQVFLATSATLTQFTNPRQLMSIFDQNFWIAFIHIQNLSPLVYTFVQLGMKYTLHREKKRRIAENMRNIENAKDKINKFLAPSEMQTVKNSVADKENTIRESHST